MASVIRICLADDCDCTTRHNRCTQTNHYQTINSYKEYPVMSKAELQVSIRRLEALGWPGMDRIIARRQAKIKRLAEIPNGD